MLYKKRVLLTPEIFLISSILPIELRPPLVALKRQNVTSTEFWHPSTLDMAQVVPSVAVASVTSRTTFPHFAVPEKYYVS